MGIKLNNMKTIIGDASESALIKNEIKQNIAKDSENRFAEMAFNSNNKYVFIIVEYHTSHSHQCLLSKGAPERIFKLCNQVYKDGQIETKDENQEKYFEQINEQFEDKENKYWDLPNCIHQKNNFQWDTNLTVMLIWAEGRKYLIYLFKSKTSLPSWDAFNSEIE